MKKKLIFLALLFSFLYGCSSVNSDVLSKDNGSDNNSGGNTDVTYTITFESNGGTGEMTPMEIKNGETKNLPANKFSRTNYEFEGWSLTANGNPLYKDGESISVNKDTVLYAYWMQKDTGGGEGGTEPDPVVEYTIIFDSNGGSGYMDPITVEKGKSVELTQNLYTRDGYSFTGWSKTEKGAVDYNDRAVISVTEDTTLYAVWSQVKQYKITYNSNTTENKTKESYKFSPTGGNVVYLDANEFTNGNMKFIGWSEDKASKRGEYQDKAPLSVITKDMNLYAIWDENPVSIYFRANGGQGTMPTLYAKEGDKIILPEATFTNEGYDLKGQFYQLDLDIYKYYGFNTEYTVTKDNATFSVLWVEQPKPEEPIRGGNSEIYRNMDVWVDGVNIKEEDWVESDVKGLKYAVRKDGSGWYDTYQGKYNLCWAAASSNLLHWWYDRNKENIEKYYASYISADKEKADMKYLGWGESNIFNHFKSVWPNNGYYTDKGLIWYLIGGGLREKGGFFDEVLGESTDFVEFYGALNQYKFNTAMEKAFKNKMAIAGGETNGFGPHAISIWGAHYDENGYIDRIYVSDSGTKPGNNTPGNQETGLMGIDIKYSFDNLFGRVYMVNYMGGEIPLNSITILSSCKDKWSKYFETNTPKQ